MVVLCISIGTWGTNKIFIEIQRQIMTVSKIHAMDLFGDMVLSFFVTSDSNWRTHFPSNKGPPKKQDFFGKKWRDEIFSPDQGPGKTIRGSVEQPINMWSFRDRVLTFEN